MTYGRPPSIGTIHDVRYRMPDSSVEDQITVARNGRGLDNWRFWNVVAVTFLPDWQSFQPAMRLVTHKGPAFHSGSTFLAPLVTHTSPPCLPCDRSLRSSLPSDVPLSYSGSSGHLFRSGSKSQCRLAYYPIHKPVSGRASRFSKS